MLRSFTISGFRNFGDERRIVGPFDRVNIFIGTNNSGKSNILRFLREVIGPVLEGGRTQAIQLKGIDRPASGSPLSSVEVGVSFERDEKHADWQPNWFSVLKENGALDEDEALIRFDVSLSNVNQDSRYVGTVPSLTGQKLRDLKTLEGHVTGTQHGDMAASFRSLMGRLFQQYQRRLAPHYIPSFRQISTRLEEFQKEYAAASNEKHLIDGLAELSAPRYDEQHKKSDFERLRKFVGKVIDDPDVKIEIPADRSTINVKSGENFLPIESLGSGIHEVVMLAAEIILKKMSVILLEEPEVHLHPALQRRLMNFITEETDSQFFITTHSSTIVDTSGARIFGVSRTPLGPSVRELLSSQDKFNACHELGYRASDLLQSNCVIWVEGHQTGFISITSFARFRPALSKASIILSCYMAERS